MSEIRFVFLALLLLASSLALSACTSSYAPFAEPDAGVSVEAEWSRAHRAWTVERDLGAFSLWRQIPRNTSEGREARRLLREADRQYRRGIRLFAQDREGAREAFVIGTRTAPMDPELYLDLARAYSTRARRDGEPSFFIAAAGNYQKFLLFLPNHPEAPAARAELAELDPSAEEGLPVPEGTATQEAPPAPTQAAETSLGPAFYVALVAALLALLALLLRLVRPWEPGLSLAELSQQKPELHPAIAYLVGSLRHELLKHRIGAVADAVEALAAGSATEAQARFLEGRLYGGEPLKRAWESHLLAFERALGPELDLHRDRYFRPAARAIDALTALESRIAKGESRALRRLGLAHGDLRLLDRHLAELVRRFSRTVLDRALIEEVVEAVRSEYAPGQVELDDLSIEVEEPPAQLEVFRVDLVLVLKNVLRNAILAVDKAEPPRRILVEVEVEVELTGEESVAIRVHDTATEELSTEAIYARRVDRGLGLVTAALDRYQGAIMVEEGREGYSKSVVLRFFGALSEED